MGDNFSFDLTKFCEKANKSADTVVRKVIFDIFSRIIQRTPVDTGRARAGWQVSINSQATGSDPGAQPKTKMKKGEGASVSLQPRKQTNKDVGASIASFKVGDTAWMANNVEYIQHLEYGTAKYGFSRQAPAGMVRVTMAEYQAYIANALASLG
jgi:hypothetical protein